MAARTRFTRAGRALLVAALALGGAACGDDDGSGDGGGGGGGGGDAATFCERYRAYQDDRTQLREDNAATPGGLDVEELKAEFAAAHEQIEGIVDVAPDEIRDDLEVTTAALDEAAAEVAEAETVEDIAAASEDLDADAEVQAAGDRVQAWIEGSCETAE